MERKPKFPESKYKDLMMPSDDMDDRLECYHSKLVKVRKDTTCHWCGTEIHKGDYALGEKCFIDGAPYYIHDCLDCVEDVIDGPDDEAYERWEKRAKEAGYL